MPYSFYFELITKIPFIHAWSHHQCFYFVYILHLSILLLISSRLSIQITEQINLLYPFAIAQEFKDLLVVEF